jgi:hypothetical protein
VTEDQADQLLVELRQLNTSLATIAAAVATGVIVTIPAEAPSGDTAIAERVRHERLRIAQTMVTAPPATS